MRELLIRGGRPLSGEVRVQGAKNSVLPILAAAPLANGVVTLTRCPRLRDVETSIQILRELGCSAAWDGDSLTVDTSGFRDCTIPDALMREMRSSVIFLGAILARCGRASCGMPGGCELGPRPIDLHLSGLRAMGADIRERGGILCCEGCRLCGESIVLPTPSVGATENLMLAACGGDGVTVIRNAAREPEIVDLAGFLNACGGDVRGAGSGTVSVAGRRDMHGCTYPVMPDRIVAATYLCAAASAGGEIFLRGAEKRHLDAVLSVLRESGCQAAHDADGLRFRAAARLKPVGPVRTAPYPGFPTDAQSVLMAALLRAEGTTVFEENLFENRYRHVPELRRMGADIRVFGRVAVVNGPASLHGAAVECTDLRGGAALCVAALSADGETRVGNLRHLERGYEDIARDLSALGGDAHCTGEALWQTARAVGEATETAGVGANDAPAAPRFGANPGPSGNAPGVPDGGADAYTPSGATCPGRCPR